MVDLYVEHFGYDVIEYLKYKNVVPEFSDSSVDKYPSDEIEEEGKKAGLNKKVTFKKPNVKDNGVGSSKSPVLSPTCSPSKKWTKKLILNDKKPHCPFRWIAAQCAREIIKDLFIPLRTIKEDIRQKYIIDVSLGQCKRAKQTTLYDHEGGLIDYYRKLWEYRQADRGWIAAQCAREIIKDPFIPLRTMKEDIRKLWEYRQALIELNPGTTCRLDVEETSTGNTYFKRMYIYFKGVKYGWLASCRKVIGLDGCFLKHTYRGELLTSIGRDANNQMHPIAWAIVGVENTEN
ncbi:hypothetical protein Tco_1413715 [Tanacetum coccineum]